MRPARLIALLFLFSCSPPQLPKKPGQEAVTALVMKRLQELTGYQVSPSRRLPDIRWREGAELSPQHCGCAWLTEEASVSPGVCRYGHIDPKGRCPVCYAGVSDLAINQIESAWCPDQPYHASSLTHEFCHNFMWWSTGESDIEHAGPCFCYPGDPDPCPEGHGYVGIVNKELEAAGF